MSGNPVPGCARSEQRPRPAGTPGPRPHHHFSESPSPAGISRRFGSKSLVVRAEKV